jgi:uncharacterized protein YyaL (SSP411 family)
VEAGRDPVALEREPAEHFAFFYDVTAEGNWEGNSVLHRTRSLAEAARALGSSVTELEQSLARSRATLLAARRERVPPLLDDKVLTAWNGLMLGAMAEGFRVLREKRYLRSAERAADLVLRELRRADGGLYRTRRAGRSHLDAYLEDYAYFSDALITLYEAGGRAEYLEQALALAERMVKDFGDGTARSFGTATGHEALVARPRESHDGALPSSNAVAARALARLGRHFDRDDLTRRARQAIEAYGALIGRAPRPFATSLGVLELLDAKPLELVVVGTPGAADREALEAALAERYLPNAVRAHHDPSAAPEGRALLAGKTAVNGRAALYVCSNYQCAAPVTEPGEIQSAFDA